jgi:hypothetical protein
VLEVADDLVVVDQFEELFTLCEDADRRRAFIDQLLGLRCAVVIGVRADIYGRLSTHSELARAVAANQVLLGAMTPDELERAVTEPARLAGLKLEPGLSELVLRDVAAEPGALPLLSHALRATWERRDGRTLTVEGYRESGGVASAIARTADAVVDALPETQRELARGVFLRMTELGEGIEDTRRRVTVEELVPVSASSGAVYELLQRLADARLVTLDEGSAQVAHEALIREWPRLREWLDEDRAGARLHRELGHAARLWDAGGREASDLYRGARLAAARELPAELNETERAFVEASVHAAGRERRRLRAVLATVSVLLLVAVGAGVLSLVQRDNALEAESAAEAQALTADAERVGALALGEPTLERSLLLAVTGVALQDRVETRGHLLTVLQQNPAAVRTLRLSKVPVSSFTASPDGRVLASGDVEGVVRFTDLRTWKPAGADVKLPQPVSVQAMRFAPDGRTLAVGTGETDRSAVHLVDVVTRRARELASLPGQLTIDTFPKLQLAFSPDGRRLAVTLATNQPYGAAPVAQRLMLLDGQTGRPLWRRRYPGPRRPGLGQAAVRPRRRPDHLGGEGRDAGVERRDRPGRSPLPGWRTPEVVARWAHARTRAQHRPPRQAALSGCVARPAQWASAADGDRTAGRRDLQHGVHARREATRGSVVQRYARLGCSHRRDRRELPESGANGRRFQRRRDRRAWAGDLHLG